MLRRAVLPAAIVPVFLASASPAEAQEACPQGRITSIFVDNHAIFDPDDLSSDRPFVWAYRLANTLHVRTSDSFLRSELLVEEGDCYDPALVEESERLLRLYPFISTVDVFGIEQPGGDWHVLADTKDEWTTKLNVRMNFEEGLEFRGVDLTEENLLGRGILLGAFLREHDERFDRGATVFTPRLGGTRLDARLSAGRTRIGRFLEESLYYPFVGEFGRLAGRQIYLNRQDVFAYSLGVMNPAAGETTHVLLPVDEERVEVTLAGRLGSPGNLTTFGLGVSNEALEFPSFPGGVEVVRGDFNDPEAATPEQTAEIERHTLHSSATRLNLMVGQRNVRYQPRRRLDAISGVQDIAVGTDAGLTLGRSVGAFSREEDQPDDLYARLRFSAGAVSRAFVMSGGFSVEGRQVFAGGPGDGGWRDVLAEMDLLAYWQPPSLPAHTFFARVDGAGGWTMDQPFQLTLGGGAGVRGYHETDFPGGRRVVASVEDRIAVAWPAPDLIDLGFTLFADGGRMWAGDAPFGFDSGWRGSVGGGVRFGFPAGTRGVVRADLAFPLGAGAGLGDVVLRVSLADLVGLAGGLHDPQLRRSRRITVGPDVFTQER